MKSVCALQWNLFWLVSSVSGQGNFFRMICFQMAEKKVIIKCYNIVQGYDIDYKVQNDASVK